MSWFSSVINRAFSEPDRGSAAREANQRYYEAQQAEAKRAADELAHRNELLTARHTATDQARQDASRYFTQHGLNPNDYSNDIENELNNRLGTINQEDATPGLSLQNIGQQIYTNRQDAARDQALRSVNDLFAPDFANSRIGNTTDDNILAALNNEQRGSADDYVNRLFKRGVITGTGRDAALANLTGQGSRVRSQLDELGTGVLESGRQKLSDIANRGREVASTVPLGTSFNPSDYSGQVDAQFNDFINSLGDTLRARAPENLYDTSRLASVAGIGSHAQNTKFDPNALAGIGQEADDTNMSPIQSKKKNLGSTYVF